MVVNFAHRGSVTEAPENTVSAIKKALAHDVQAIEIDVQLTKDNHLVIVHDHHLRRFNKKIKGDVRDYTLKEIKQFNIGAYFSKEFANEKLATLEEMLEIIPKTLFLNIEIKNAPVVYEHISEILLTTLKKHERTEHVLISSFNHETLQYFQTEAPHIPLGLLFERRVFRPLKHAKQSSLEVYSIHPNKLHINKRFIKKCHKAGYKVYPYTVNDVSTYQRFKAWGVDGVFSDNPAIFSGK